LLGESRWVDTLNLAQLATGGVGEFAAAPLLWGADATNEGYLATRRWWSSLRQGNETTIHQEHATVSESQC